MASQNTELRKKQKSDIQKSRENIVIDNTRLKKSFESQLKVNDNNSGLYIKEKYTDKFLFE